MGIARGMSVNMYRFLSCFSSELLLCVTIEKRLPWSTCPCRKFATWTLPTMPAQSWRTWPRSWLTWPLLFRRKGERQLEQHVFFALSTRGKSLFAHSLFVGWCALPPSFAWACSCTVLLLLCLVKISLNPCYFDFKKCNKHFVCNIKLCWGKHTVVDLMPRNVFASLNTLHSVGSNCFVVSICFHVAVRWSVCLSVHLVVLMSSLKARHQPAHWAHLLRHETSKLRPGSVYRHWRAGSRPTEAAPWTEHHW